MTGSCVSHTDEVALSEVVSHHELVLNATPPQHAPRQVHGGQLEYRVQPRVSLNLPTLLLDLRGMGMGMKGMENGEWGTGIA